MAEQAASSAEEGGAENLLQAMTLYQAALQSPAPLVREAAANQLIPLLLGNEALADADFRKNLIAALEKSSFQNDPAVINVWAAAQYSLEDFPVVVSLYEGRNAVSFWNRALSSLARLRGKDPPVSGAGELLNLLLTSPADQNYAWVLEEASVLGVFTEGQYAAATGRLAIAGSAYADGLRLFKTALDQDESLFLRYPELLSDTGRAFQFTTARDEGLERFLAWERLLQIDQGLDPTLAREIRYRLLYFAARIERQRGQNARSAELFSRALDFAPDSLQEDACIWYILNLSLNESPEKIISLLNIYAPRWNSPSYFADILDRLAWNLAARRQWQTLAEVFPLIHAWGDGESVAKYAYIAGRALDEGYISAAASMTAQNYFRIAFEEGRSAFYYRGLGALALGEKVDIPPGEKEKYKLKNFPHADVMEFLLCFFEFDAASFTYSFLEKYLQELSIPELRALGEQFVKAENWEASIRLVINYSERPGFELTRRDMELFYPLPFKDLIEAKAKETGLSAPLLYGLIRTESAFNPGISSRVGALGLTQLMDATAEEMAVRLRRQGGPDYRRDGVLDLSDPETNIHLGAVYLSYLIDRMESPLQALLAYNGGMGRIRRWRSAAPALPDSLFLETIEFTETREYGRKVLSAAAAYGYLYYGMSMEEVLADICK